MAENFSGDSIGKKIVDALKIKESENANDTQVLDSYDYSEPEIPVEETTFSEPVQTLNPEASVDEVFMQNLNQNIGAGLYSSPSSDIEYPQNIAIIHRLINKLPAGVPKQTGALIIRQTLEALGISMDSVIQETKQFKELLNNNALECQKSIVNYRKQITMLELKTQQFQRQVVVMNDIINLFARTNGS